MPPFEERALCQWETEGGAIERDAFDDSGNDPDGITQDAAGLAVKHLESPLVSSIRLQAGDLETGDPNEGVRS
jgi:hypothetical protein